MCYVVTSQISNDIVNRHFVNGDGLQRHSKRLLWDSNCEERGKKQPITVAARSNAWNFFALSNPGIVSSNLAQGMDICVHLLCACYRQRPCDGLISVQGVLSTLYKTKLRGFSPQANYTDRATAACWQSYLLYIGLRNWKSGQGPKKDYRVIDR
jgi:hypothetical protein